VYTDTDTPHKHSIPHPPDTGCRCAIQYVRIEGGGWCCGDRLCDAMATMRLGGYVPYSPMGSEDGQTRTRGEES
jgi:hypothetical protein